jgi:signal transduction histidine kinase
MRRTLTLRLVAASAVWIAATLGAAGLLLVLLFADHIERQFDAALGDHLEELVAASDVAADGALVLGWQPFDPRFNRPRSGWYWQIGQGAALVERSASLWPDRLEPGPATAERLRALVGPGGEPLRALVRLITLPGAAEPLLYVIAGPVADIAKDVREFATKLALTLLALGLGLVGAVAVQVRYGLSPLRRLRMALAAVRAGTASKLPETFPAEVQPLVQELNALLEHDAMLVERARTQTGNLAHALRSPLTVIRSEAERLEGDEAVALREQAELMARQIDWHLARARAAGSLGVLGARAPVAEVAEALRYSLERLHAGRRMPIELAGLDGLVFAGDPQDLEEMLGNLMDNACKWARSRARVAGVLQGGRLRLGVEDDGPGIPEADRAAVLRRGTRLDEAMPGTGLGLAIVRDLAALYRGSLDLARSELGGLRATLDLPAA